MEKVDMNQVYWNNTFMAWVKEATKFNASAFLAFLAENYEAPKSKDTMSKVNRFEVIDHTSEKLGRELVKYGVDVELSFQDDDKTLKVFLTDKAS